jgi:hypothetical protein
VVDVAVFTGEEMPRRAVLPEQLVSTLPGVFGPATVAREAARLANRGGPQEVWPDGVSHSANIEDPVLWIDALHGYAYDSINPDALLRLATVRDGRIVLPGGASYGLLVLPGPRPLAPDPELMSPEVATRLCELVEAGATVLMCAPPRQSPSLQGYPAGDATVRRVAAEFWPGGANTAEGAVRRVGQGRVIAGPFHAASFEALGLARDFTATDAEGWPAEGIAWTHRTAPGLDLYFISNQRAERRRIDVSLRVAGRVPELWDSVDGGIRRAGTWRREAGRTILPLQLEPAGSVFVVLREPTTATADNAGRNWLEPKTAQELGGPWQVSFDPNFGGPKNPVVFARLEDWTKRAALGIRYYSGTAVYQRTFTWSPSAPGNRGAKVYLELGHVANIAEVTVNGVPCGVAWTAPWRVEITPALRAGNNDLRVAVTNTWANRLIGDHALPEAQRLTRTTAPYRLEGKPLLEAGLLGPVALVTE